MSPPFAIQLVIEGEGDVTLADLTAAVEAAGHSCPGSRLIADGAHWRDSGRAPPVRETNPITGFGPNEAADLWRPLDPNTGPTCEVLLSKTAIVFRAFHGVMDGKGAMTWATEVFRALRGETLQGAPSTQTDLALLASLGTATRRPKLKFDCASPLGDARVRVNDFLWRRVTLQGSHPGLVAKLAALLSEDEASRRFMVPVDLRRHDRTLRSTGNLSLPIFLSSAGNEPWEVLHERLLQALASKSELATDGTEGLTTALPVWGVRAALHAMLKAQAWQGKYMATAILSHLGRIDLSEYSSATFAAHSVYSLPVHTPLTPLALVAVECGQHVELTLTCPQGDGMDAKADALLARLTAALAPDAALEWAGNRTEGALAPTTVAELFAQQVERTPDAVALVAEKLQVSYRQLDERAEAFAQALIARGIGPGRVVALLIDRTVDAVASILGVLRAGAAYLPVDPEYPEERIAYLLRDSGAALCLVQRSYAGLLESYPGEKLFLDSVEPAQAGKPHPVVTPTSLAYIIYTSGSTGQPKGVEVEHQSLVNYLTWAKDAYSVNGSTRFALFTSLSFDLTVTALLLPLVAGGSVTLYTEEMDHLRLQRMLTDGATALKLTPTHLDLISRLGATATGFQTIIVGGEQLKSTVAARAQDVFGPKCKIINEYGPTEATVGCVFHVYDAEQDDELAVPVGVPILNTRISLLDSAGRPVALGEEGEIYIVGDCVARGYRARPELTRERFVRLANGQRAYRTGDLARIKPDGRLEYLGRTDEQLKIRGHRIEPAEIEAALGSHPQVAKAVVLGRARSTDEAKVLCAYIVRSGNDALSENELREYLSARVPRYAVPTYFVEVLEIGLTVNGKVDTRSLPNPFGDAKKSVLAVTKEASFAEDSLEAAIVAIWAELLRLRPDTLDRDADFALLGGDSLQMIEMLARVAQNVVGQKDEEMFMRNTRAILKQPTLENVCSAVRALRA